MAKLSPPPRRTRVNSTSPNVFNNVQKLLPVWILELPTGPVHHQLRLGLVSLRYEVTNI